MSKSIVRGSGRCGRPGHGEAAAAVAALRTTPPPPKVTESTAVQQHIVAIVAAFCNHSCGGIALLSSKQIGVT